MDQMKFAMVCAGKTASVRACVCAQGSLFKEQ